MDSKMAARAEIMDALAQKNVPVTVSNVLKEMS